MAGCETHELESCWTSKQQRKVKKKKQQRLELRRGRRRRNAAIMGARRDRRSLGVHGLGCAMMKKKKKQP